MPKVKVGLIGCGAIGSSLARMITLRFRNQAVLAYICDRHLPKARGLRAQLRDRPALLTAQELIRKSDLIIEAASASISGKIAQEALLRGKDILILSVGGLLEKRLPHLKGRLWIPSGAIAGVDALLAAREAGLISVKLITRKPPAGLSEAPYFEKKKFPTLTGKREYCIFKGSAADAVKNFPQNVNVAALLSLAGAGPRKTRVEIWTSRAYRVNQHEVTVTSRAGVFKSVTWNKPFPENPKTSALAAYSAAALLRKIFSTIKVGT